jgi:hypothetical protein
MTLIGVIAASGKCSAVCLGVRSHSCLINKQIKTQNKSLEVYLPIEIEKDFSSRVINAEWFVGGDSRARRGMGAGRLQSWTSAAFTTQLRPGERHLQRRSASREHEKRRRQACCEVNESVRAARAARAPSKRVRRALGIGPDSMDQPPPPPHKLPHSHSSASTPSPSATPASRSRQPTQAHNKSSSGELATQAMASSRSFEGRKSAKGSKDSLTQKSTRQSPSPAPVPNHNEEVGFSPLFVRENGANAGPQLLKALKAEFDNLRNLITCNICFGILYEPYTTSCGHTYCYSVRPYFP